MATYLEATFDKRLSRIEEQIKQFKTTQRYGMNQVQYVRSDSMTFSSSIEYLWEGGRKASVIRKRLLFTGIYLDAVVQGKLHLLNYVDSGNPTRDLFYYGTDKPNELIIDYTSFGRGAYADEPDPPGFSETMEIITNMPGSIRVL